jgi:MFS family permease
MLHVKYSSGFRTFTIIWFGQIVSLLGTDMTRFALMIWAYRQTGAATPLALLGFFAWLPYVLVSPIAGVWVDRLDRRCILILADLGSGLLTAFVLGMYLSGQLAVWHMYVLEALTSICDAFQYPAYGASVSLLLDKQQYARANGMRSLAYNGTQIAAPVLGGALLPFLGIGGVLVIDIITFGVAMLTLALVRIPSPRSAQTVEAGEPFAKQASFGFHYIFARPGLTGLMCIFMGIEFFAALTYFSVMSALILARSGGNAVAPGMVQALWAPVG